MGGGASRYTVAVETNVSYKPVDWLASPNTRLVPMKNEEFDPITAIGKGKFGLVFLSKHIATKKYVAVKYIPKQIVYESKSAVRIQQEISLLEIVDHPFIVFCFGGFETPTCKALVFEYAHGGELYNRMKHMHTLPESHSKFYFCEIALALSYLQDKLNYVYRDLKPENVLIDVQVITTTMCIIRTPIKPTYTFVEYKGPYKIMRYGICHYS